MKNCTSCDATLFTAVAYCPFCGHPSGVAAPAETAAAAPSVASAPAASMPALAPEPVPVPEPAPEAVVAPAPRPTANRPKAAPKSAAPKSAAPAPAAPAPAAVAPATASAAVATASPRQRSWGKFVFLGVVVLAVIGYLGRTPAPDDKACSAAFDAGTKMLSAGDLAGARTQSLQANALCRDAARVKAETLATALADADKAGNACGRALNAIDSEFDDQRLNTARDHLNQLDGSCSALPAAAKLRQKLTGAQANAAAALQTVRQAIAERNKAAAHQALERLASVNSEAADLPALTVLVDRLPDEVDVAEPSAPALSTTSPTTPQPVAAPKPAEPPAVKPDPALSAKTEMAQSFVRDAETALAQRKFDAARTYLDSARRMDPGNPKIDGLAQQIRERERQLLQQETTIR
ncbi:hypothetical protein ACXZ1M_03725 [Duganella sp. PWIR1]